MQRRDFVKALVSATAAAAAPTLAPDALAQQATPVKPEATPVKPPTPATPAPGPVPWTRGLNAAKPLPMTPLVPGAEPDAGTQFLSDTQMKTLRRFCALLMPPLNDYPGATEAGVPEFLDFLLSTSPADRQKSYVVGLDRLQSDAHHHFSSSFDALSDQQADQLIRPFLRAWISDHPPTDPFENFINVAHSEIRTATINSQAWSDAAQAKHLHTPDQDLFWYPIDPELTHEDLMVSKKSRSRPA